MTRTSVLKMSWPSQEKTRGGLHSQLHNLHDKALRPPSVALLLQPKEGPQKLPSVVDDPFLPSALILRRGDD